MKTEAEQAIDTSSVWADEAPTPKNRQKLPGSNWPSLAVSGALAVLLVLCLGAALSGLHTLHALAAQIGDNGSAAAASRLAGSAQTVVLEVTLAAIVGGITMCAAAVLGMQALRKNWHHHEVKSRRETEQRLQKLLAQIADATVSQEESRKAQNELKTRLADISQNQTVLQQELNERRQAERSLTQQAQQLERSKDVLELHVQSRTQELQKLQRRNELILNSAGDGIIGFDLEGRATFVNPAAAKLTGLKIEQMIGRPEAEIFFSVGPKSAKPSGLAKNEKGEFLTEQSFYRRDGSSFAVEYIRTAIIENNKTVGAVVMFKDITERRLAEDKLAHKAAELSRSNAELEQFAFVASHDLQEPLRKIQAFGDRLKIKCEAVKLEEGKDYLERMQSAAARMQTLINDLLTFSRIIRSSQPFTKVDLASVTKEVLGDLEHRIERTRATVTVGKLPAIDADPLQMRQLLQNLIGNALKFQPPGGTPVVKIDAQLVTRDQIRDDAVFKNPPPTASGDDKFCALTVQDNGIGFEEQYLEKIFAVFQRLHGRSEYEGTGVGLAVCRRITDRHGGLITAQSKLGEGATFVVILPLKQPKQEEPQS